MDKKRIPGIVKAEVLSLIEYGKYRGRSEQSICDLLMISSRRIRNWKKRKNLKDIKPGPIRAPHSLLETEKEAILKMAKDPDYVDDSPRVLSAKASDLRLVFASASSFYRQMRKNLLTMDRFKNKRNRKNINKPDRKEITKANQRWCWDISYIPTVVKGVFLYLYLVIDEYSRKAVAWRISWYLSYLEGKEVIQNALENENLTEDQIEILSLYNDRGAQMKAKSFMNMLQNLGITQVFSRPRTPNDNPFIESAFSIVKCDNNYPCCFNNDTDAIEYFSEYFKRYNCERLHGGIGYVTPEQKHEGLDVKIIQNRKLNLKEARKTRISFNQKSGILATSIKSLTKNKDLSRLSA